jgi:ATP-dependent helicase HrpA
MSEAAHPRSALQQARRRVDDALARDRGRLLGLWSRWNAKPTDTVAQTAFADALAVSIAAREARAAFLPASGDIDESLPIAAEAERIVELIRDHQVVVIAGETGSGKTTQLPKLCLAAGRGTAGLIGCTQPRRIAARAVARRVAEELKTPLGGAVGFQVRFNENVGERTAIKFMTDGILLAEIQSDRWLSAYDTIIIDEAHERSLNIDFLLGYLKQLLVKRRDLKVIVTSATIDTERFSQHFDNAPVVNVEGRGYPVEVRYRPLNAGSDADDDGEIGRSNRGDRQSDRQNDRQNDRQGDGDRSVLDGIVSACDEIVRQSQMGDVLIFLPGEREIRDAHQALEKRKYRHTEVLPLYARLSARDQDRVFNPGTQRRIVLATNVAETSLTVPRIHFVVDPGFARVKRYSPRQKLDRLHIEAISQASADQRKGRCGRIAAGVCYRLYSEAEFLARDAYTDPEIRRAALAGAILRMLSLGLGGIESRVSTSSKRAPEQLRNEDARVIENFPFLDPPDPRAIADGWQHLSELGAVDAERKLTPIGRTMARLPVDVKLSRMLIAAHKHGCLREMLAIASFLGIQDPRERPADQRGAADAAHAQFADSKSEFIGILKLWDAYRVAHEDLTQSQLRKWADKHFLGFLRLREWRELHRQLKLLCDEIGWDSGSTSRAGSSPPLPVPDSDSKESDLKESDSKESHSKETVRLGAPYVSLHRALIAGLPTQIAHRGDRNVYDGPRGRKFQMFPGSTLASKPPLWLLSATLLDTEKVWSIVNAAIEPEWAIDELPHLLARRHHDPHWSRAQGRVVGSEQISLFGLILAPKKPVHYGALFPQEARQIFVRDALATGEINTRAAFLARNLAMLAKAKQEEAKQRRVGLVVDEDWQAQWYLDRLPPQIHNQQVLDAWYAKLPAAEKAKLEWSLDDLMIGNASDAARFPPYLPLGDARLAVQYRFDPGAADDGMTVAVPLHLLNALDPSRLSWLAPGFILDKATALIKSLPKTLRRNFVPAPDFARAFAEAYPQPDADSIESTLARFLKKLGGIELSAVDFDSAGIEPHLRANLRLMDAQGRHVLAESRDLDDLRSRFGKRAAEAFSARAAEGLAQVGLCEFPAIAIPLSISGAGGVPAYPALHDDGDSVSLAVHADRSEAQRHHPQGVRRLLRIDLAENLKQARKQLPVQAKTSLLYAAIEARAPRELSAKAIATLQSSSMARVSSQSRPVMASKDSDRLREDLIEGAFLALAADGLDAIRDAAAFARRRDAIAKALFTEAMERLKQAETILARVAEVRAALESNLMGWAKANLDDMHAQLAALASPGFLRDTPAEALREYPRYLKALSLRAERALRDPTRDQARMLELKPFADALEDARDRGIDHAPGWQALRWELEEFRVSLFAQELGAKSGISAKKLAIRLAGLAIP